MSYDHLKLSEQLCFPVYAVSRLITREYQPLLEELGLTYPQYLVMMVLWENDNLPVNEIARKLILNTNTITPLLKRMETQGLLTRERSEDDERKVIVRLTAEGYRMRHKASDIPYKLVQQLNTDEIDLNKLMEIRDSLNQLIHMLTKTAELHSAPPSTFPDQ